MIRIEWSAKGGRVYYPEPAYWRPAATTNDLSDIFLAPYRLWWSVAALMIDQPLRFAEMVARASAR